MATSAKTAKVISPLIHQLRVYYSQREDAEEATKWREVPNELYSDTVSMLSFIVRSMLHRMDSNI
jgi:hypothetical protein